MLVEKWFDRFILGNIDPEVECFVGIDPEVDCEGKGVGWRRKKMKFSITLTP